MRAGGGGAPQICIVNHRRWVIAVDRVVVGDLVAFMRVTTRSVVAPLVGVMYFTRS